MHSNFLKENVKETGAVGSHRPPTAWNKADTVTGTIFKFAHSLSDRKLCRRDDEVDLDLIGSLSVSYRPWWRSPGWLRSRVQSVFPGGQKRTRFEHLSIFSSSGEIKRHHLLLRSWWRYRGNRIQRRGGRYGTKLQTERKNTARINRVCSSCHWTELNSFIKLNKLIHLFTLEQRHSGVTNACEGRRRVWIKAEELNIMFEYWCKLYIRRWIQDTLRSTAAWNVQTSVSDLIFSPYRIWAAVGGEGSSVSVKRKHQHVKLCSHGLITSCPTIQTQPTKTQQF